MELAVGIEWQGSEAKALLVNEAKEVTHQPLAYLARNGLPLRMSTRVELTTDFARWTPSSFVEFAGAVDAYPDVPELHATWQFMHGDRRYVVPSLALMRTMFRPPSTVFPALYRSQSLEDLCTFSGEGPTGFVAPIRGLGERISRVRSSKLYPLSWLFCFPSARAAWASVLRFGAQGQLGLELPKAEVSLVLTGVTHARNVYVTAAHIHKVVALEEPFEFATTHPRTIHFLSGATTERTGLVRPKRLVALRDGEASVSDAEWHEIEPLLNAGPAGSHGLSHQRATLDGVLSKLCFATIWRATKFPSGVTESAAATALHRWRADGRWEKVEEALRRSRGEPPQLTQEPTS